jgi:hypothetical protein
MSAYVIAILRAFHIVGGSLWVGATVFNALYLIPAIAAAGPAGGQVMRILVQVRRMPVFMNSVMGVTLLSGIALYGWDAGGSWGAWVSTPMGLSLTIGAALAITVSAIGSIVAVPSVRKLGQLGAEIAKSGGPPSPEQSAEAARLQGRMLGTARLGASLLVLTAIAMAVARYL